MTLCSPSRCTLGSTSPPPCLGSGALSRSPRRRNAASSWELLSHELWTKLQEMQIKIGGNSPSSLPLVAHSAEDLVVRSVANTNNKSHTKCIIEGMYDNMRSEVFRV